MNYHFYGKGVGYSDAISGVIYGQQFHIHGMKEPDFTMVVMATYVLLERSGNDIKRRVNGETVLFKYP